ncbi:vicilin-like seed storage protein At2g18540 [Nasonia vitripennis]|uniref:Uncharacterized protein n=1 Tax=Nasonia vitripennis TaxID=7425 RepID=A0A7M7QK93_NASVI|nr:vicilin-like seed storage protein At2g18540 [Nasonia vitripennis]
MADTGGRESRETPEATPSQVADSSQPDEEEELSPFTMSLQDRRQGSVAYFVRFPKTSRPPQKAATSRATAARSEGNDPAVTIQSRTERSVRPEDEEKMRAWANESRQRVKQQWAIPRRLGLPNDSPREPGMHSERAARREETGRLELSQEERESREAQKELDEYVGDLPPAGSASTPSEAVLPPDEPMDWTAEVNKEPRKTSTLVVEKREEQEKKKKKKKAPNPRRQLTREDYFSVLSPPATRSSSPEPGAPIKPGVSGKPVMESSTAGYREDDQQERTEQEARAAEERWRRRRATNKVSLTPLLEAAVTKPAEAESREENSRRQRSEQAARAAEERLRQQREVVRSNPIPLTGSAVMETSDSGVMPAPSQSGLTDAEDAARKASRRNKLRNERRRRARQAKREEKETTEGRSE